MSDLTFDQPKMVDILKMLDKDGNLVVRIPIDGEVEYGSGYDATLAAREFWSALQWLFSGSPES